MVRYFVVSHKSNKAVQLIKVPRLLTFLLARDDFHVGVREEEVKVDGNVCPQILKNSFLLTKIQNKKMKKKKQKQGFAMGQNGPGGTRVQHLRILSVITFQGNFGFCHHRCIQSPVIIHLRAIIRFRGKMPEPLFMSDPGVNCTFLGESSFQRCTGCTRGSLGAYSWECVGLQSSAEGRCSRWTSLVLWPIQRFLKARR